jgi:hypothetical protein
MLTNATVDAIALKSVVVKTTGHEKLRITVMLSVLAAQRKLNSYDILKRIFWKEDFLAGLYLIVMRKVG